MAAAVAYWALVAPKGGGETHWYWGVAAAVAYWALVGLLSLLIVPTAYNGLGSSYYQILFIVRMISVVSGLKSLKNEVSKFFTFKLFWCF